VTLCYTGTFVRDCGRLLADGLWAASVSHCNDDSDHWEQQITMCYLLATDSWRYAYHSQSVSIP